MSVKLFQYSKWCCMYLTSHNWQMSVGACTRHFNRRTCVSTPREVVLMKKASSQSVLVLLARQCREQYSLCHNSYISCYHTIFSAGLLHHLPSYQLSKVCRNTGQLHTIPAAIHLGGQVLPCYHLFPGLSKTQRIHFRGMAKKKRPDPTHDESDSDGDDALDEDDFAAPPNFKIMKIHSASLRTDAVISNSLGIARNRLEEIFFGSGLLLNGRKMTKKSEKMEEGDYVDVVMEKAEEQLKVKRVKVIKVFQEKTSTGKLNLKVRVWKTSFAIEAPDNHRRGK